MVTFTAMLCNVKVLFTPITSEQSIMATEEVNSSNNSSWRLHHSSGEACSWGHSVPYWAWVGSGDGGFWSCVWVAMLCWSLGWHIHGHEKAYRFEDTYFCYKKFVVITLLACVDARGIFTYVNAYTYRHSLLFQKIASGKWLAHSPRIIAGVNVKPFIVADSAFSFHQHAWRGMR